MTAIIGAFSFSPALWGFATSDSGIWISNWPKKAAFLFFLFKYYFFIKTPLIIAGLELSLMHVDLGTLGPEG